jgi:hypothetical protein
MTIEVLMIIAIIQLLVLVGGAIYLLVWRRKREEKQGDVRMEKLSEDLMAKLESQSLSVEQKRKIAEALKEVRDRLE